MWVQRWAEETHPYWNRTGGKDHIFLASPDEGSCLVPEELRYPEFPLSNSTRSRVERNSYLCLHFPYDSFEWLFMQRKAKRGLTKKGMWGNGHKGMLVYLSCRSWFCHLLQVGDSVDSLG
jgi:hypothetical protein